VLNGDLLWSGMVVGFKHLFQESDKTGNRKSDSLKEVIIMSS
jgi:hypothetical protein